MNKPSLYHLLWQITYKAAFAPVLVLIFRGVVQILEVREQFDHVMHFSGGLAIAFFWYRSINIFVCYLGDLRKLTLYFLTFTASCTVALFWEFAEFSSDFFLSTHIQHSLTETLLDLIFGTLGASLTLCVIMLKNR